MEPTHPSIELRVAEAPAKDVGRGLARLDPEMIAQLDASVGDVVQIIGQRTTVARLMPTHSDQRGQGLVQIDGIVRTNAGVSLDDMVTLSLAAVQPARTLVLGADDDMPGPSNPAQVRYLARLLDRLAVVAGDRLRVTLFGTRAQRFHVVETTPPGPVLIGTATTITLTPARAPDQPSARPAGITYEDIGGLRRELRRIREMIELPLRHPEVFARLGIDPPRGVLLHGPPGCGKTLIARAVAHEASAYFIHINGPEIIDKWYGASEANLRNTFEDARKHAPSIIFIDEIDAIAPSREELAGDRQIERRVVAQLLTLMDGLDGRGNVVVIGATNLPNNLDPALRRPGRFDREIAISVPDRPARREIIEIYTRGMPLEADVDVERLASATHGYVGADLAALCREAAMSALRRVMPDLEPLASALPEESLLELKVAAADFRAALAEITPSAVREVFTEVSDVAWSDVGGLAEARQALEEAVEWPLRYSKLLGRVGLQPPRGIILHGPPGCGKTLVARALASQSEVNFIAVKGPQLLSMWVGESERAIRKIFQTARQAAPCIIFLDEVDSLAPIRCADGQVAERVVGQLLTELDGIEDLPGVLVLAATNRIDRVDPALLRPGRLEIQIALPPPNRADRLAILRIHTRRAPLASDVDLEALAEATAGRSGAELAGFCRRAARAAIREYLANGHDDENLLVLARRHFTTALQEEQGH
ncbi:MAG: AAA family ATPase [Candidatus Viridilinea halotolerans]|uniref:AAA family ATPase n=1 Tax=Candidatus Viridilinea halotolerans TaxID=2491704 RepID=A0A426U827_9CHLR|nr:MAG: AAA family ATPase [Candidatus Viridilinea halotolerans]